MLGYLLKLPDLKLIIQEFDKVNINKYANVLKLIAEKIADELSDVLFMIIRIADHYKIDLEKEHLKQLDMALKHPLMKIKKEDL